MAKNIRDRVREKVESAIPATAEVQNEILKTLQELSKKVDQLHSEIGEMANPFNGLDARIQHLDNRLRKVESTTETIGSALSAAATHFNKS